ncbi:MAG: Malate dehydrogenase (EC [uncultured Caballeronia sp.]|nr:MAG: Malate dehydrogenase (EC [uncultured Caballeronia sp.]
MGGAVRQGGMVSFHFVNVAGDPLVAPFGGIDWRFGTNPFCAACPRSCSTSRRRASRTARRAWRTIVQ